MLPRVIDEDLSHHVRGDAAKMRAPFGQRKARRCSSRSAATSSSNVPISCGNTVVCPGDLVVGDADGVVVVPHAHAAEVLDLVTQLIDRERARVKEIQVGGLFRPDVDDTLRKKGVIDRT
jgi:regulator of RNase E activity RraA